MASKQYANIFADFFAKHSTIRICIDAKLCSWHTVTLTIDSQGLGKVTRTGHISGSACEAVSVHVKHTVRNIFQLVLFIHIFHSAEVFIKDVHSFYTILQYFFFSAALGYFS
jgi:hypothetical protein